MYNRKNLILLGGGGHCRSCIEVIRSLHDFEIFGILDPYEIVGKKILEVPFLGNDEIIAKYVEQDFSFLVTVGHLRALNVRLKLYEKLVSSNASCATIVSNTAYISDRSQLGNGTIVMHNAFINSNVIIGQNCILNTSSLVEHDSIIGSHVHVSTGAVINGGCEVGDRTFLGSGSVLLNGIKIAQDTIVGAGAVVTKNILQPGVYVGCPAKRIK